MAIAGALIQEDVVHTSHDRKQSGHRGPAYSARGIAFSSATAEAPAEEDDSSEGCPSENDEDTMPESWNQDEDEETEPDDDAIETDESYE